jgi:sigma-B regulation protein RsbU (phosphoserine phosphatase)
MSSLHSNLDAASTLKIANNHAGLKEGLAWLGAWLKRHGAAPGTNDHAHLVFEEIVTNITRYAFSDNSEHLIVVGVRLEESDVTLTFEDDGRPFDPRSEPAPPRPDNLEMASIGGRGLLLVRRAARRLDYKRTKEGHNLLSVTLANA